MYEKPISEYTPEEIRAYQQKVLDESYAELNGRGNICAGIKDYEVDNKPSIEQQINDLRYQIKHVNNYMEKRKLQQELNGLQYKFKKR